MAENRHNYNISYRPEIDGLRALAIISVIIYHFKIPLIPNKEDYFTVNMFSGGFLGVDIFFVISGYLITSIIIKEIQITQSFNFYNFFLKRFRRLIPAMLFTIIITLLLGIFFLLPSENLEIIKSSFSALFFSANFYFNIAEQDYWSNIGISRPLLNLWTLSLEEQYYLALPFFLLFIFKNYTKYIFHFLVFIFIVSIIINFYKDSQIYKSSFYLLHTRVWEFIPGSVIAIYRNKLNIIFKNKKYINLLTLISIIFVIFPIFSVNNRFNPFELNLIFYTLSVVTGTSFLIIFLNKNNFFYKFFTFKIVVYIGLISYSLYLLHYPFFSIYNSIFISYGIESTFTQKFYLISLLITISTFMYYFIEKKFRYKNNFSNKLFLIYFLLTVLFILILSIITIQNSNTQSKFNDIYLDNNYYAKQEMENFIKPKNFSNLKNNKILIIGDSNASNLYMSMILNSSELKSTEIYFINTSSIKCINSDFIKNLKSTCNALLTKEDFEAISLSNTIIITKRWNKDDLNSLDEFVKNIKENKKIIISNSNIPFKFYAEKYTILDRFLIKNKKIPNDEDLKKLEEEYFKVYKSNIIYSDFNKILKNFSNKNNIIFFNREPMQCDVLEKKCLVLSNDKKKLVYDYDHFTMEGYKVFGLKLIKSKFFLENIIN